MSTLKFLPIHNYGIRKSQLGDGTYSTVDLHICDGKEYAIKKMKAVSFHCALNEVACLIKTRNERVISIIDVNVSFNLDVTIIMENYGIDLHEYLCDIQLSEEIKFDLSVQLLEAVNYIHHIEILHGDIKPQNILIKNDKLKLADFGVSKGLLFSGCEVKPPLLYSGCYRCPEIILRKDYTLSADIWATGCVIYKIYNDIDLFNTDEETRLLYKQCKLLGTPIEYLEKIPKFMKNENFIFSSNRHIHYILERMIVMDPKGRQNSFEILKYIKNNTVNIFEIVHDEVLLDKYFDYPTKHRFKSDNDYLNIMINLISDTNIEDKMYFLISYIYDFNINHLYNNYTFKYITEACIYIAEAYVDVPFFSVSSYIKDICREILINMKFDLIKALSIDYLILEFKNKSYNKDFRETAILFLKILSLSEEVFNYTPKQLSIISINITELYFNRESLYDSNLCTILNNNILLFELYDKKYKSCFIDFIKWINKHNQ